MLSLQPSDAPARVAALLAHELDRHGVGIDCAREGLRLTGVISLPTFNRGVADQQFLFVNSRPVKDRLLVGALRAAYRDLIARDRHPIAALFLDVPLQDVDVNVHPAKTEVRFRDPSAVRGLIVGGLRRALDEESQRSAAREQAAAPVMWTTSASYDDQLGRHPAQRAEGGTGESWTPASAQLANVIAEAPELFTHAPAGRAEPAVELVPSYPLGVARGQVAATYIVAEAEDGLVIVDQHAAHERLVLERMRAASAAGAVTGQALLMPEVVELDEPDCDRLEAAAAELPPWVSSLSDLVRRQCWYDPSQPPRKHRSGSFACGSCRGDRRAGRPHEPSRQARSCSGDDCLSRFGARGAESCPWPR